MKDDSMWADIREQMVAAIDKENASEREKEVAKNLLQQALNNRLVVQAMSTFVGNG